MCSPGNLECREIRIGSLHKNTCIPPEPLTESSRQQGYPACCPGRQVACLADQLPACPAGQQGRPPTCSLASFLAAWLSDGLASCLAGCLPGSPFACWLIYLLPSSPAAWQAAQFARSWVRLWAQNSLLCKAGDRSVGVLYSSNLECPMKQKFPSQQGLVISLQDLSMYSVTAIMSP